MQRGQAAIDDKNLDEAVKWFGLAVEEAPKDAQARACLGQALCWQGKREEGGRQLRQAGQLLLKKARKTREVNRVVDLADQLQYWNDYPGSADLCKQAIGIDANFVRAYQLLALALSRLNQTRPALIAAKQALKRAPDSAMLNILLATMEIADKQLDSARARLEHALSKHILTAEERFRAHKELARVLDKLAVYDQVFPHLHAAGEVSARLPEVQRQDKQQVPEMLGAYKTEFDSDLLGRWAGRAFPSDTAAPVFVLGFMRTGTTLTQEVLGAHPGIFVADETDLIVSTINELKRMTGSSAGSVAQRLRMLDFDDVVHLRRHYWQRARALFGDALASRLLLDKTTMNSIDIGFIQAIFPDARLVFLLRDPRDVCLSCFSQTMTPSPSTVHLLTWQGTAQFYAQVMDWWQTVKPRLTLAFMELKYEDAVFDFENTFKQVFGFLNLAWDPAVADFHKKAAGKVIVSPSFSQVAQPLYSSSVGRWRQYASEYAAIDHELQSFLVAYGYD
ncbi:MAG: sulfotransferase [Methylomonas sp.]|nr:sulfotransferase [Methylomonas sp.]PPD21156.1 MAG: sulfotransferase [Methylomonas sp.]PPD27589.1 MAG: sulfotransferase [Methylomonas sp.]PPD39585.1 MAG: sulfotransferase [Methylomonas sp.]PPD55836.1 MAG: sulfotransferase [Methylomonas sp.]